MSANLRPQRMRAMAIDGLSRPSPATSSAFRETKPSGNFEIIGIIALRLKEKGECFLFHISTGQGPPEEPGS